MVRTPMKSSAKAKAPAKASRLGHAIRRQAVRKAMKKKPTGNERRAYHKDRREKIVNQGKEWGRRWETVLSDKKLQQEIILNNNEMVPKLPPTGLGSYHVDRRKSLFLSIIPCFERHVPNRSIFISACEVADKAHHGKLSGKPHPNDRKEWAQTQGGREHFLYTQT